MPKRKAKKSEYKEVPFQEIANGDSFFVRDIEGGDHTRFTKAQKEAKNISPRPDCSPRALLFVGVADDGYTRLFGPLESVFILA